jgi:hypothetical protein
LRLERSGPLATWSRAYALPLTFELPSDIPASAAIVPCEAVELRAVEAVGHAVRPRRRVDRGVDRRAIGRTASALRNFKGRFAAGALAPAAGVDGNGGVARRESSCARGPMGVG